MDTKDCLNCGRSFERPLWANAPKWRTQKFCSLSCANSYNRRSVSVPASKTCPTCAGEFTRPASYTAKQWLAKIHCSRACHHEATRRATAERKGPRTCPICGEDFIWAYENQVTCRSERCKAQWRQTVSGPAQGARMRADYAAGLRKRVDGLSPRERALWPLLRDHGWLWRLRWTDAAGGGELDFAHQGAMVNVEIDGVEHREPRKLPIDAARDEYLASLGWTVVRIPNTDVDADLEGTAQRIIDLAIVAT